MARPSTDKDQVRVAYVRDRLPLEAAAERAGVPLGTARRWKSLAEAAGDDWDRARAVHSLSAAGTGHIAQMVLADFIALHLATMEELKTAEVAALDKAEALSRLADAFTKTMSAVAKAAPDLGRYAVATELLQDLADFIARAFPEHRAAFAVVLEPYAAQLAAKLG